MPKDPDVPQAPSTTEPPARSPEPLDESERRLIDARLDLLGSVKAQPPGPPGA